MCDCHLSKAAHKRLICVEDFCGTCHHAAQYDATGTVLSAAWSHGTGYWADYDPHTGLVHYGGDWQHIPDLVSFVKPSESAVHAQAKLYGGHCQH